MAWHGEEPVAAAIFLRGKRWAHYHLAGSTAEGRQYKASTLLVNEGARWAHEAGCELLHLGGGLAEDDGLARFKFSFSDKSFDYHTLAVLSDSEEYQRLCKLPAAPWPYSLASQGRSL